MKLQKSTIYNKFFAILAALAVVTCALCGFSGSAFAASEYSMTLSVEVDSTGEIYASWTPVENADFYELNLNGVVDRLSADTTSRNISDFITNGGLIPISVSALCNGEKLATASFDFSYVYTLDRPAGIRAENGSLLWQPVKYAVGYRVTADGVIVATVTDTRFDLSILAEERRYNLTVTALGEGEFYADSAAEDFPFLNLLPLPAPRALTLGYAKGRLIASWPQSENAEGYGFYIFKGRGSAIDDSELITLTKNYVDVTEIIADEGVYTLAAAAVRNGTLGAFVFAEYAFSGGRFERL